MLLGVIWGLILGLAEMIQTPTKVLADNGLQQLYDLQAGLGSAPTNLGLASNMFTIPNLAAIYGNKNMAALVNERGGYTGTPVAIKMTMGGSENGVIWSNVEGGNYIDINQPQTMSMWLYFGPSKHKDGSVLGDGIAFVVQNSPEGSNAVAHKGNDIGKGETLGVWGIDNDTTNSSSAVLAQSAIQNSWALEFDTLVDNDLTPGGAAGFDLGLSGQHIADGFPGEASMYQHHNGYFTMNHSHLQPATLTDGNWHHLTVSWDPTTYEMKYKFNDKNRDGTDTTNPIIGENKDFNASHFGGHSALNAAGGHLRWGFTATTGSNYEPAAVAFESIPSLVDGDVTSEINDKTQNKTLKENDSVNSQDDLALNYKLTYNSGRDDWQKIVANMILPNNIDYSWHDGESTDGSVGKITYSDGTSELIYPSEIAKNTAGQMALTRTLTKDLSASLKTATITINGRANNVTTETKVPSVHSNFDGATLIKGVDTTPFVIKKSKPINLKLDQTNISVTSNKDANITGTVSYTDPTNVVDNSKVNVYATLNGTALDKFTLNSSDPAGKLNFNIPASKITQPINTLKVYVEDSDGNTSTTSTVVITKTGGLDLKVDDYSFGNLNDPAPSMLIPRRGPWNIIVDDTRQQGTTPWKLSAKTDGLFDGTTKFDGDVIYKNSSGQITNINNDSSALIATGLKTQEGEQLTNVGTSWNDAEGIMLKTNGVNLAGQYQGKMTWVLSDTV